MNDLICTNLTETFIEKREIAKEEIDPQKDWLKRILINNNSNDLKLFLKAKEIKKKKKDSEYCANCKSNLKHIYLLNASKSFCELCEEIFCVNCSKSIDIMKDNQLKYIRIKLCKNCFIYTNEIKCIINPSLSIDQKAIDMVNAFNEISNRYTTMCTNVSQLNGLTLLCENNQEFLNNFKNEIKHLADLIEQDLNFLNNMKKKNDLQDNTLILSKMSKNLLLYIKIIRNKILPDAIDVLNKTKDLFKQK
ncbi:zinc finger protein, putative [Hepatocystis sp. ex Piliocolobus tephrosceles]|nr:zinc finger protein, putative [Hepatocystis sp. ex Piliocolobus tephrosceles]